MQRRSLLAGMATFGASMGAGALPFLRSLPAEAAPSGVLVVAVGETVNSLDIQRAGTNRISYGIAVNAYDRLLTFGTKTLANGDVVYDPKVLKGEIAESWDVAPDNSAITIKLKPSVTFQDGTPLTSADVKWSLDRAVSIGGFPTAQAAAGQMTKPEQFEVVDPHTIRIKILKPSKLTLMDLAVPTAVIINSTAAKKHATEQDPWAAEWLHRNTAGSGGFKVERWDPGQQVIYVRNDHYNAGPLPKLTRVIQREIPNAATRRALVDRGDIGINFNISGKDAKELAAAGKLKVIGEPIPNTLNVLIPNTQFEPFKDKRVRQAIAYAIPYEQIFEQAAYGRGEKMWGGKSVQTDSILWPQPMPYTTDYDKAKELLAQTAFAKGFEVPLSFDMGAAEWSEPAALLIQEGFAKIGIKVTLERVPSANWRTIAFGQKKLPLAIDGFGGWLDTPDYYFNYNMKSTGFFNAGNYNNPEMDALIAKTLDMETTNPDYAPSVRRMISLAFEDVPRIPLWQPWLDSAMQKNIQGYQVWFHRMLDLKPLSIG